MLTYQRRHLNKSAAVHFASEGERQLATRFGITAPQVVIDLGLDVERYSRRDPISFRSLVAADPDKKLVTYMGRIAYTKGVDLLVGAFSVVAKRRPDVHLVIIGPDHEGYRATIEAMISELGLRERVTFTGVLAGQRKIGALAAADVAVFPSYTETFGFSMLEAMACGVPVVISSGASLSSEAAKAGGAFLAAPNRNALAKAIFDVLAEPRTAKAVAVAGERFVNERFSWRRVATAFIDLYSTAVNGRPQRATG